MGIVYFIQCLETNEIYIGSTKQTIKKRMKNHRNDSKDTNKNTCSSKQIIDRRNYIYEILEEVEDNDNLRQREQYYIETTDCINMVNAFASDEVKKKQNIIKNNRYLEKNREKVNDHCREHMRKRRQMKVVCECGTLISLAEKPRHMKTKKHFNLLSMR